MNQLPMTRTSRFSNSIPDGISQKDAEIVAAYNAHKKKIEDFKAEHPEWADTPREWIEGII